MADTTQTQTVGDIPVTTATITPEAKPGWKTSEFWLSLLATVLGSVVGSGLLPTTSKEAQIAGVAATALAAAGYTASRTVAKK